MKKIIILIAVILIIFILMPLALIFNPFYLANSFKLYRMEKELAKIELPSHTYIIENQSAIGKLFGNGNGMDYLVTAIIESQHDIEYLKEFYGEYGVEVQKQSSQSFYMGFTECHKIKYENLNSKNYYNLYVIYLFKSSYKDSYFDFRGH